MYTVALCWNKGRQIWIGTDLASHPKYEPVIFFTADGSRFVMVDFEHNHCWSK